LPILPRAVILAFAMKLCRLATLCGCLMLLGTWPARAAFKIRSVVVRGATHLFLRDVSRYYGMTFSPGATQVVLSSRYSKLVFFIDKRESVINGVKTHLSLAPARWEAEAVLSETDFRLLLDPILRAKALPQTAVRRIVLDPGHGGRDHGAAGKRYREKDLALQVARRLADELQRREYVVKLTRTKDKGLPLEERPKLAKGWDADLFISLHANYAKAWRVKGIETFLITPEGTPSTYGKRARNGACSGNRFDKRNAKLAYEVQKGLTTSTGGRDRGVKHAQFLVLRDAPCPAVLLEMGFLSNAAEEKLLGTAAYQDKLVKGLVEGILRYHQSLVRKD